MNVNIRYSIELDKLPKEVKKLLVEARQKAEGSLLDDFEQIESDFEDENYFRILKVILEIRKKLYSLDVRLQDCHSILADYQKLSVVSEEEENVEQLSLDLQHAEEIEDEQG